MPTFYISTHPMVQTHVSSWYSVFQDENDLLHTATYIWVVLWSPASPMASTNKVLELRVQKSLPQSQNQRCFYTQFRTFLMAFQKGLKPPWRHSVALPLIWSFILIHRLSSFLLLCLSLYTYMFVFVCISRCRYLLCFYVVNKPIRSGCIQIVLHIINIINQYLK